MIFYAVLWGVSLLSGGVSAEEPAHEVVIAALETDPRNLDTMAASVRSQLSDLGAEVRVHRVSTAGGDLADPQKLAAAIAKREGSAMVVLVSEDGLGMYLREAGAMTVDERSFPAAMSWEDACDASASIIRSVFEVWLVEVAPDLPPLKEEEENADTTAEPDSPEKGDKKEDSGVKASGPPPTATGISVGIGVEADYVVQVARSERSVLHGAHGGLCLRLTSYVRLGVGVDILQSERWSMDNWRFDMRRVPVRTTLSGQWMRRWLTLGASLSFVADITRMTAGFTPPRNGDNEPLTPDDDRDGDGDGDRNDLPEPDSDPNFALPGFQLPPPPDPEEIEGLADSGVRTFFGLGAGAYVAFRAVSWLDIGVAGGCDFYFNDSEYLIHFAPPLNPVEFYRYQRVQPRVMLQLTFWVFDR